VPLDAECFQIERGALLDQRRSVRKRPLPERDDDSHQPRLLARDRRREQLVQLTQDAKPDRADAQRRRTAPLDPKRRVAVQPQRRIAHNLHPDHIRVADKPRLTTRQRQASQG